MFNTMSNHILARDTQAILLLCASFGQNRQTEPLPLTLSEYNLLTEWLWLREDKMRPADLLETTAIEKIKTINKLNPDRIIALLERGLMLSLAVEKWTSQGLWISGRSDRDPKYPKRLHKILKRSAPPIIYGVGNAELLSLGGLAIVGSRDVDEDMIQYTHRVAKTCSQQNIQVISGGARGIDQESMLGILNNGGTAVGILADSLTKAAVNSKYRSGIREGRLTLISSYDPDAGFNIGNAMGRNKYIYSLADYALVVKSDLEKGGTWNGAVEALSKFQEIPVFVNMISPILAGNQELFNRGAKPFPLEFENTNLREIFTKSGVDSDLIENQPILVENVNTMAQELINMPKDIYDFVSPLLLNYLQQPKSQKDIESSLNVTTGQIRVWLNRAIDEKKVIKRKIKNRVVYNVNTIAHDFTNIPKDIYEVVLPLLLNYLQQPKSQKDIESSLNVTTGQIRVWLNRAIDEKKVIKRKIKNRVVYEVDPSVNQLSFL